MPEPDALHLASRCEHAERDAEHATTPEVDQAVLAFQETMRVFLRTQHKIMAAYLRVPVDDHSVSGVPSNGRSETGRRSEATTKWLGRHDDRSNPTGASPSQDLQDASSSRKRQNGTPPTGRQERTDRAVATSGATIARVTSSPNTGPWAGEVRRWSREKRSRRYCSSTLGWIRSRKTTPWVVERSPQSIHRCWVCRCCRSR